MIGTGIGLGVSGFRLPTTGFVPSQISGLLAYYITTDASTLYQAAAGSLAAADGDPVGQWQDKSGGGFHWAQASGTNKPALKLAIKNSKNIVRFDGVNDYMSVSGSAATLKKLHTQANSIFFVLKPAAFSALQYVTSSGGGTSLNIGHDVWLETSGAITHTVWNAGGSVGASAVVNTTASSYLTANNWYVISIISDPSNGTAASRSKIYKNGGSVAQNNTSTGSPSASNSTFDVYLGGKGGTGTSQINGDIAACLMYDSALSDTNRGLVESYLNNLYGVY